MKPRAIDAFADGLWLAAGLLCLLLAARVGFFVAGAPASADSDPATRALRAPSPVRLDAKGAKIATPDEPDAGTRARADTITPQIIVGDPGTPRAAVWIDGVHVGETPYIGDVTCQRGAPVRVELVVPHGAAKSFQVECRGTLLRLPGGGTD